tara:strand:- start:34 stop:210 length:177 start_codon:yes stop_codon:yes gene_type:complete
MLTKASIFSDLMLIRKLSSNAFSYMELGSILDSSSFLKIIIRKTASILRKPAATNDGM